jgi:hypothetical protein
LNPKGNNHVPLLLEERRQAPEAAYSFFAFQKGDLWKVWRIVVLHGTNDFKGLEASVAVQQKKDAPLTHSG